MKTQNVLPLSIILACSGCAGFRGPAFTLDAGGPHSTQSASPSYSLPLKPVSPGLIGVFETSYKRALDDQLVISGGAVSPADTSNHARQMAVDGVALVDANCMDFFASSGANQKWLNVAKDLIAVVGTAATGALAISSPANGGATAAIALFTSTAYGGADLYTRNFLFGADNIDSVRVLTFKALDEDTKKALPSNDTTTWSFANAVQVITQHQHLCTVASIRGLAVAAIKSGTVTAAPSSDPKAASAKAAKDSGPKAVKMAQGAAPKAKKGSAEAAAQAGAAAAAANAGSPELALKIHDASLEASKETGESESNAAKQAEAVTAVLAPAVKSTIDSRAPSSRANVIMVNGEPPQS